MRAWIVNEGTKRNVETDELPRNAADLASIERLQSEIRILERLDELERSIAREG